MTPARSAEIRRLNDLRGACEREWQEYGRQPYRTIEIIRTDGTVVPRKKSAIILDEVCRKHDVDLPDLRSASRMAIVVRARREAMGRLRKETNLSLPQIGRLLDKHHTTVLNAVREYERLNRVG